MNCLEKHRKKLHNYDSLESKVSYILRHAIVAIKSYDPKVHYFEIKNHWFKNKITLTIYCERPEILIGKGGQDVGVLTQVLSKDIGKHVRVLFKEYRPFSF